MTQAIPITSARMIREQEQRIGHYLVQFLKGDMRGYREVAITNNRDGILASIAFVTTTMDHHEVECRGQSPLDAMAQVLQAFVGDPQAFGCSKLETYKEGT